MGRQLINGVRTEDHTDPRILWRIEKVLGNWFPFYHGNIADKDNIMRKDFLSLFPGIGNIIGYN